MFPRRLVLMLLVMLWCVLLAAQNVREIALLDLPGNPGFDGMAVARGMVLMSHSGAGTVDIFDPMKRRLVAHVKGMSDPRGIAIDDDGGRIFIANYGARNIVVLAAEDWRVVGTIALNGSPAEIAYIPAWGMIAATDPVGQRLLLIDVRLRQQANALPLAGTPSGLAFDPSRGLLCVTLQDDRQVITIDRQLQIVRRMRLNASQPTGIVYDPKQDHLYVSVRYAVLSLNAGDGAELARVPADGGIDRLWLDQDSRTLYGAAGGSILVMRAEGKLHAVDELATEVKGYSVAYDAEHRLLLFPGGREGRSKLLLISPIGESSTNDPNREAKLR